jgi:putative glycosyltransferase (TIGR04372 family)
MLEYFLKIFSAPVAIPIVVFIRLIKPIVHVRLGTFETSRIGHFVADVGIAISANNISKSKSINFYYLQGPVCNKEWSKMTKRELRVHWIIEYLFFWNNFIPGGKDHVKPFAMQTQGSRDKFGSLEKAASKVRFLPSEEEEAKSWLSEQGWREGEPFVCLIMRDSAYLTRGQVSAEKLVYHHEYRNSDISTYVEAAEYLADNGVWVIRMGTLMKDRFPTHHPKIIDYAFSTTKKDLLDIWLFASCYFCISTSTGPDIISNVYKRPMLFVNASPLGHLNSWSDSIWVPKRVIWEKSGNHLNLREMLQHNYFRTEEYTNAGIRMIDLSPKEIFEAVDERVMRSKGTWTDNEEDIIFQKRFWEQLKTWNEYSNFHEWIHPKARVGAHFLRHLGDSFYE